MRNLWFLPSRQSMHLTNDGDTWRLCRKVVRGGDETPIFDSPKQLYAENWLS